jgi:hypothetical protein
MTVKQKRVGRSASHALYLADLRAAGREGMELAAIAEKHGVTRAGVHYMLRVLREDGLAVTRWLGGSRPAVWFAAEHAPPDQGQPVNARTIVTASKHAARLDPDEPAIVPPGVVIQVCPASRDFRFSADPALAGRGQITRDWRERRLQEVRR